MNEVVELVEVAYGLDRRTVPRGLWRRRAIRFFFVSLDLEAARHASDAGRRLWPYRPADGHPCYFITSEFFASFIDRLDLNGKRVADVGMGSGILALAAARAGAACVTAVDVNPKLQARLVAERSIFIESLIIYELEALH